MNRPLTVTAEHEKQMRIRSSFPSGQANLDNQAWIAEIDATRAALDASEQTIRELRSVADKLAEALNRVKPWVISYIDYNQAAGPLQDLVAALAQYAELASSKDPGSDTGASKGGARVVTIFHPSKHRYTTHPTYTGDYCAICGKPKSEHSGADPETAPASTDDTSAEAKTNE